MPKGNLKLLLSGDIGSPREINAKQFSQPSCHVRAGEEVSKPTLLRAASQAVALYLQTHTKESELELVILNFTTVSSYGPVTFYS